MRYSPINEHAWRWKSELGNTEWHEPKPKLNYNSNGCSVPRHLMGNHFRPRLPLLRPMVRAGARETESSEPLSAPRWGKAQSPRRLASVLDQARCWIWTPTVSHNQQWFMCNARSRGAHEKDRSKRIILPVLPMRNCVVVALIQARDGHKVRLGGKSFQEQKRDPNEILSFFRRLADGGVRGEFRCKEQRRAFRRDSEKK